jgi:predicted RNA-binding protein with PIN domain
MNVIGARPDGWWRDREAAMRALVVELAAYSAASRQIITVVLDGRVRPAVEAASLAPGGSVTVVFAPGGPDAADDEIARLAAADPDPASLAVVSSDATLAKRVRASGARVIGAGRFRRRVGPGPLTR